MKHITKLQQLVIKAAKEELASRYGCRVVCIDDLPSDQQIKRDFDAAVAQVVDNTVYWEGL